MLLELQTIFEGVCLWLLLYITTQYNSSFTPAVRLLMGPFEQLRVEPHFCASCSNPSTAPCTFAISYTTPEKGQLFSAFCHVCKNRVM